MTINHVYNIVIDTMKKLKNINLLDISKRKILDLLEKGAEE